VVSLLLPLPLPSSPLPQGEETAPLGEGVPNGEQPGTGTGTGGGVARAAMALSPPAGQRRQGCGA
jgi:hypothetical protein